MEPLHLAWIEDTLTGDYSPYPNAQLFKEVTQATSTPIHTGEEIYLRENFKDLIENQAVNVIGPDPEDVGGIAELSGSRNTPTCTASSSLPTGFSTA
jgi:L-alanine-DL-glutamate epimerase-like enolase superfamily enzyme